MSGFERSPVTNCVPPLRWAITSAVSGVICIKPEGAGVRLLIAKPGLGVDHRRDQRRVKVLGGRLLADDVLVAERQGELADRLVEVDPTDPDRRRRRRWPPPPAIASRTGAPGPGPRAPPPAPAARGRCRARGSRRPRGQRCQRRHESSDLLLELCQRAIVGERRGSPSRLLLLGELAAAAALEQLGSAITRSRGTRRSRPRPRTPSRRKRPPCPLSNSSGTSTTASAVSARQRLAPVGDPHPDQRVERRLEPGQLARAARRRSAPTRPRSTSPPASTSLAPALVAAAREPRRCRADRGRRRRWRGWPRRAARRRPAPPTCRQRPRRSGRGTGERQAGAGWCQAVGPPPADTALASERVWLCASAAAASGSALRRLGARLPRRLRRLAPRPPAGPRRDGRLGLGGRFVGSARRAAARGRPLRRHRGPAPPPAPRAAWPVSSRRHQVAQRQVLALDPLDAQRDPAALLVDLEDPHPGLVTG